MPKDELFGKLLSNLHKVQGCGGELIAFADKQTKIHDKPGIKYLDTRYDIFCSRSCEGGNDNKKCNHYAYIFVRKNLLFGRRMLEY